jgi:hypothetical protein
MCAAPCPADPAPDPLVLPSEAELRSLFAKSFEALNAAEFTLDKELEHCRAVLDMLCSEAENRISPSGTHFMHRQMEADTFTAKESLSTCLRHMDFAIRTAVALRNALNAKA